MINYNCHQCGQPLESADDMLNELVTCPKCKSQVRVRSGFEMKLDAETSEELIRRAKQLTAMAWLCCLVGAVLFLFSLVQASWECLSFAAGAFGLGVIAALFSHLNHIRAALERNRK